MAKGNSKSKNTPRTPEAIARTAQRKADRKARQEHQHANNLLLAASGALTPWQQAKAARAAKYKAKVAHRAEVAAAISASAKAQASKSQPVSV